MTTLDLRYVAGIFDGEGYVYIFEKKRGNHVGYYLSVGITMCHRPIIETIYTQFGGHFNGNRTYDLNLNHRNQFTWGLTNSLAAEFLRQIRPHSIIKQAEIDVGLALQDHIDLIGYPKKEQREEIRAYREELFLKCKELKKVNYEALPKKHPDGGFGTPVRRKQP